MIRVWNWKNHFENPNILPIEWGISRVGKFRVILYFLATEICLFVIQNKKDSNFKMIFPILYPFIYNLVCNYGWYREIIYKQTKKVGTVFVEIVIFITVKRVGP